MSEKRMSVSIPSKKGRREAREISMFSVGTAVWILMAVELAERIAYYGTAFTLTTFCVDMLRMNLETTNIVTNLLYVVSPVAAVISGGLSDAYLQRKKVLAVGGALYAVGLSLVAISGSPFMFPEFPNGTPYGSWGTVFVVAGVMTFGCGYGTMKVCIAPLLADTALVGWGKNGRCCGPPHSPSSGTNNDNAQSSSTSEDAVVSASSGCKCGCEEGGFPCRCNVATKHLRESISGMGISSMAVGTSSFLKAERESGASVAHQNIRASTKLLGGNNKDILDAPPQHYGGNQLSSMDTAKSLDEIAEGTVIANEDDDFSGDEYDEQQRQDDEDAIRAEEVGCLLSKLFRIDYWVINFGSMIGIGGAPFLRALDGRTRTPKAGDSEDDLVHAGYYIGYWACAAITAIAIGLFLIKINSFASNRPGDAPGLFRTLYLAFRNGCPIIGRLHICSSSDNAGNLNVNKGDGSSITESDVPDGTCATGGMPPTDSSDVTTTKVRLINTDTADKLVLQSIPPSIAACYHAHFNGCTTASSPTCPPCTEVVHNAFIRFLHEEGQETTRVTMRDAILQEDTVAVEAGMLYGWAGPSFLKYSLLDWFVAKHMVSSDDVSPVNTAHFVPPGGARAIATTITVCSSFIALPIYWLLSFQFATNVVMQADWMAMPAPSVLPPEVFNNVNTLTILVSIPIFEYLFKRVYGPKRRPPVAGRIVAGFVLMLVAMSMVAFLQAVIVSRGTFVADAPSSNTTTNGTSMLGDDDGGGDSVSYVLSAGQEYISAMWLVIPYFIQGLAAVLVDTTCIEAAYTSAPENMKGSVMALYLLASSVSGFLGLIYAPFISPQTMLEVMISLVVLQGIVTIAFVVVSTSTSVTACCKSICMSKSSGGAYTPAALEEGGSQGEDRRAFLASATEGNQSLLLSSANQHQNANKRKGKNQLLERVVLAQGNEEE